MKQDAKTITMNILNGLSVGIIVALVPGAILNAIVKLLLPSFPQLAVVTYMTGAAMTLLPALSAVCVGMLAKFTPIQTSSLALAAIVGAGNYHLTKTGLTVAGTGDVINLAITLAIGYLLIVLLGDALKAYTILLIPSLVLVIAGGIGMLTLGPVSSITKYIGVVVHDVTALQPIVMGVLMGIIFAVLIVSPISTVGIATAISLTGIGAGSANLGIVGAGFALATYGWKANSFGTSLAHFLPVRQKCRWLTFFLGQSSFCRLAINAGILGGIGAALNIQGTPASAGFGFSGLVGPLAALDAMGSVTVGNVLELTLLFFILPIALAYASHVLFTKTLHYQDPEDYALNYN
ncbi:PTS sugar transporter subunit IIC [Lacticaseibacillus paracasei subsp. paracasei]|nr:PTS sugar transporter subunit IIC [Lacticaseibacillus paracasei subsp. paracasei]